MTTRIPWTDPIVEEVHRIREEMLEEAGGDLAALGALLKRSQLAHRDRLVRLPPKRLEAVAADSSTDPGIQ